MAQNSEQNTRKRPRFTLITNPTYADFRDSNDAFIPLAGIPAAKHASIVSKIDEQHRPSEEFQCRVLFTDDKIRFIANPPLTKEDLHYLTDILRCATR